MRVDSVRSERKWHARGLESDLADTDVVREVLKGDTSMFELLVRRHNERLFRVGMGYLKRQMDTEDAMQETYLKAFKGLRQFRGESAVATWLTRIMVNECLMKLRKYSSTIMESIDYVSFERLNAFRSEESLTRLDREELKHRIEDSISRLPRDYRVVYLMRESQNLSTAETARCLDLTEQNVKVRLHRARKALQSILSESLAELDLFSFPATYCNPFTNRLMSKLAQIDSVWDRQGRMPSAV